MGIIPTNQWLQDMYEEPIKICKKIEPYFDGVDVDEIYNYLIMHGMYRYPTKKGRGAIQKWQENKVWNWIGKEKEYLRKKWNGPEIPIFILPADTKNPKLMKEQNGKSGVAFNDKLFLFISENNSIKEIKALFTHEYNHICRLSRYNKRENNYCLLDSIIMEGLAENAVMERFGERYMASWTTYYSEEQLEWMWNRFIHPNRDLKRNSKLHHELLYGLKKYPRMMGYSVGYYLVKNYKDKNNVKSEEMLEKESNVLAMLT